MSIRTDPRNKLAYDLRITSLKHVRQLFLQAKVSKISFFPCLYPATRESHSPYAGFPFSRLSANSIFFILAFLNILCIYIYIYKPVSFTTKISAVRSDTEI